MHKIWPLLILFVPAFAFADAGSVCTPDRAVATLRPGASFSITNNGDLSTLVWQSTQTIPTQTEIDAQVATCQSDYATGQAYINQAKAKFGNAALSDFDAKVYRAIILVAIDEINALRDRDTAQDAAIAAATSLSDLKARWALLAPMPDRTPAQAKTAINNKLDSGAAN